MGPYGELMGTQWKLMGTQWGLKNWKRSPWGPGDSNGDPCGSSASLHFIVVCGFFFHFRCGIDNVHLTVTHFWYRKCLISPQSSNWTVGIEILRCSISLDLLFCCYELNDLQQWKGFLWGVSFWSWFCPTPLSPIPFRFCCTHIHQHERSSWRHAHNFLHPHLIQFCSKCVLREFEIISRHAKAVPCYSVLKVHCN